MTNELIPKELQFDVEYEASKITIHNEDKLEEIITAIEKKYSNLVFNEEDVSSAKEVRAELNKLDKKLNDERIAIKREYTAPLTKFEDRIKSYSKRIKDVNKPIAEGIADFDKREREERRQEVIKIIEEAGPNYNVELEEVEIRNNWLNKISKNKRVELVTGELERIQREKERKEADIKVVTAYCEALDIDSTAWLLQLEQEVTPTEIMAKIDQSEKERKEREEAERLQKEKEKQLAEQRKLEEQQRAEEKRKLEEQQRAEEQKKLEEQQKERHEEEVDRVETASMEEEIVVDSPEVEVESEQPNKIKTRFEFLGTPEQYQQLQDFIGVSGLEIVDYKQF